MKLEDFEANVEARWLLTGLRGLAIAGLGLSGEAGEVSEHVKKVIRNYGADPAAYPPEKREKLLLELGDVQFYLTRLSHIFGFTLAEVMEANIKKLCKREMIR